MVYRCEAMCVGGFVQQLAVSYLRNGYWFYVAGRVPEGKDPAAVDRKLVERYGIDLSKWARARRKRLGMANLQYLRYRGFFLLLATHGEHRFFVDERAVIRDVRRQPITFAGYAVTHRGGRSQVRIERTEFRMISAHLLDLAVHRSAAALEREFLRLPFEPYAPVRRQLLALRRSVNGRRKVAGFEPVPITCIRLRRRIYRPFERPPDNKPSAGVGEGDAEAP
jgi:hypothetical protein